MKKLSISSIVGASCGNPECEVHSNLGANYYRLQFIIDSSLLKRILAAYEAFVANKFEGYLTFDVNSEVEVFHHELINDGSSVTELMYKDLKWKELEPKVANEDLYFHFDIDHDGRLGFTVDSVVNEEVSMVGNFGPIKSIIDLMDLGHSEWPKAEARGWIAEEDIASPSEEAPVTKPMLH